MKTFINIYLFSLIIFCSHSQAPAQETIQIHSKILNEDRELFIHLPKSYNQSDSHYPVLFILDGGYIINDWPDQPSFARHIDSLTVAGKIPEIIAVGIANVNRIRDFNPTPVEKYPTSGGADQFLDFFYNELIPYIDLNYKTVKERILFGHSAGGLLAIYSFLSKPDVFQRYIAASPGLSWDDDYVVKWAKTKLAEMELSQNIFLHISLGEKDYPKYIASINRFSELLKQTKYNRLSWDIKVYPELEHNAVAHTSFVDGLKACFLK